MSDSPIRVVPRSPFVPVWRRDFYLNEQGVSNVIMTESIIRWADAQPVEQLPGLTRRTLGATDDAMVVEFRARAGVQIPVQSVVIDCFSPIREDYVESGK